MPQLGDLQVCGTFAVPTVTQNAGTVITALIPPFPGPAGGPPLIYKKQSSNSVPNWWGGATTHVTSLVVTSGGTSHSVYLVRPRNFAYITTAVAKNTATFILDKDPGIISTNYRYRTPNNQVPCGATSMDVAIAATHYVAYQLLDGTWVLDTVASGSYTALVLTTVVPNVTGGGVAAGTPMFLFGLVTNKDPATAALPWSTKPTVSLPRVNQFDVTNIGGVPALHPGDPMMLYDLNNAAADVIDLIGGYYSKL